MRSVLDACGELLGRLHGCHEKLLGRLHSFHDIVFNAVKRDVRSAILELIRRERECEIIDRKLVKEVVAIFVEMGGARNSLEVWRDCTNRRSNHEHGLSFFWQVYVNDFEELLLSTTADFYTRESAKWAEEDSFPDYMCEGVQSSACWPQC